MYKIEYIFLCCRFLGESAVFQVEDQITVEQFSDLMTAFHSHGRHRHSQGTVAMSTEEFRALLSATLERPEEDERLSLFCNKASGAIVIIIYELVVCFSLFCNKISVS